MQANQEGFEDGEGMEDQQQYEGMQMVDENGNPIEMTEEQLQQLQYQQQMQMQMEMGVDLSNMTPE